MTAALLQELLFMILLLGTAFLLGSYIYTIYQGDDVFLLRWLQPVEKKLYRFMHLKQEEEMSAKAYAASVCVFSFIGLLVLFVLQLIQQYLPLNPEHMEAVSWDLAFNSAASFVTNTNWQAYAGENSLSYLTQMAGLTVQNFVSAATGIAVLFVLMRGFTRKQTSSLGNFRCDMIRIILYLLLPLSVMLCLFLISQGVVQSFASYADITTLEGVHQTIPLGPAASQIAIKQLGTNGGGFFGANAAFPFENPTPLSSLIQTWAILAIPAALCVTFGKAVKDQKQGKALLITMTVIFVLALLAVTYMEFYGLGHADQLLTGPNMEGKEVRFGIGSSSLWAVATTAASNGSVNAMHDSFTPIGGMILMFLMMLGEIVFGGVGCGLYGMLAFALLTVFMAGLMVGRTPEYIGKKIGAFDMKMVCIIILTPPICLLLGTALTTMAPQAAMLQENGGWLTNTGSHGFSELLYAFTSMAANNGSAFAGFLADSVMTNLLGGIIMLVVRFIPMCAVILLAGNLASKKPVANNEGTLSTTSPLFICFLSAIIVIVGALTFLPALALGPIAEFFFQFHG